MDREALEQRLARLKVGHETTLYYYEQTNDPAHLTNAMWYTDEIDKVEAQLERHHSEPQRP